ncbi:MAG: DUF167 domain-containing protein [Desulfovibrionaceae bacterium]|nr:DUF167 domain-containing protein [Desulfovibrionaceae bacterium]MBF0514723.1 DUF167 domain-containing protein [Desulfovibrionaceae bacterium]
MDLPEYLSRDTSGAWLIAVWACPGAKKNALDGVYQQRLKVKIAAPAVDGKANTALTAYLAKVLHVPGRAVSVASGQTGRRKTLRVDPGATPAFEAFASQGS